MDIYDYLQLDHDCVDQLFKQFNNSNIKQRQEQIAEYITQKLLIHLHSEQSTFYKALLNFENTKGLVSHSQKEHQEIEDLITSIRNVKETDKTWVRNVHRLKDLVEHHVKEEEGELFTKAKTVLTKEDAIILKEKMHYRKEKILLALEQEEIKNKTASN